MQYAICAIVVSPWKSTFRNKREKKARDCAEGGTKRRGRDTNEYT